LTGSFKNEKKKKERYNNQVNHLPNPFGDF